MNHQQQLPWACLRFLLLSVMVGVCVGVAEGPADAHTPLTTPKDDAGNEESLSPADLQHDLRKRFIWTLTQEPYFYGKYGRGAGVEERGQLSGGAGGSAASSSSSSGAELLPEASALRSPSSMHKRLYPRWYQAYVYKSPRPSRFAGVSSSGAGERKRFQPFHPLARFRGLSAVASPRYQAFGARPDEDPGHRLPTAPNAQTSFQYGPQSSEEEEGDEEEEGEEGRPVKAGELLQLLKTIATDRGLTGHTKGFSRFGISRK